ncbi:ATP-binding protein [Lusitaniella coriacea LEGE 07157]|uniref:ATP-binding protein n=1 Tax=Lusitaniella coriacea LEGE 07157 TaxID=945747 RepID=A0A8J7ITV5_9CYAN|nr:ATP-binding protein [Lusitaniella coriacea]MBE9116098.1 ATP-binding protein [Lusitaniella coriacea LEGE 07157]
MSSSHLSVQFLQQQAASLLLYQSVLEGDVGQAFLQLLETLQQGDSLAGFKAYGRWFRALATYGQSWQDYVIAKILQDANPFSDRVQRQDIQELPPALVAAAKRDLQALQRLSQCNSKQVSEWLTGQPVAWIAPMGEETVLHEYESWEKGIDALAAHYRQRGTGLFARYSALSWQQGQLWGISHPDPVQLGDIIGYELQKEALIKNTEFLLAGYRALHVLLYGSRGSGKSSLIKGLLNQYAKKGLRLIEVTKSNLKDLPAIVEQLRDVPQKFVIFVDDLSFEEDDEAFKALKVVLEGSVTARSRNVVVYATSNRRHLVREFFSERPRPSEGDEVHAWDTMQEKLSFRDRFGLTLTFEPANQDTYLTIVRHLANQAKIDLNPKELEFRAKQWATRHNGRSGRTAQQFIDFLSAELALF